MPSTIRPRPGGLSFHPPMMPLEDNGPPAVPPPGPTDHIYMWEARTSKTTEHRFSGSARGSQVMIPVGKCRVSAPMIGWEDPTPTNPGGSIYFAFCFGVGPAETIDNFVISGQDEADISTVAMPITVRPSNNCNLGTDDQDALYYASTLWGGGVDDAPKFPNLITTLIGFKKRYMSGIGLPTLQADLSMQSYDFRSGTEAYTENENPILYLYTYMVMNPWGPRVPTSEIDTTSWTTAANWCDADMDPGAGSQKRWRVGGVLDGGDVSSVIATLLQSCFTTMSWQNGKWVLVPFAARNIASPTDITADYIRRRRIGLSRRPTVVKVNYRDYNSGYADSQAIARSADAVAGTARWVVREDSPPLINYKDVATRYAKTLLDSVSNSNRATVKVHHDQCPAVLDLKPGDNVHLSTWREKTGHGGHDYWRVESINHQELVSELELLGDEDALSTQLTTNTSVTRPTIGRSSAVSLGTDGEVVVVDSDGDAHTALTITSDYLVIGDPDDPVEIAIYADDTTALGVVVHDSAIVLDADKHLEGRDSEGGPVPLIGIDSSEVIQVGSDSYDVQVNGEQILALPPLDNNVALQSKETGGTARNLLILNSSDVLNVGQGTNLTVLNGSTVNLNTDLCTEGNDIVMDDDDIIAKQGWRVAHETSPGSATYGTLLGTTGAEFAVGQASGGYYRTVLGSKDYLDMTVDARLANNKALEGTESGGTARDLIVLDASNDIIIGNATTDTKLYGSPITSVSLHKFGDVAGGNYSEMQTDGDLIQAGTAKIETAASMEANNTWSSDLQATKTKALANNVGGNFFKWGSGAAAGASMHYRVEFLIQVQYTYGGGTYYWTRGGSVSGTIQHLSASLSKGILLATVWDGAGIAFKADGTSGAPSMGESVTMNTSVAAADLGPAYLVNLTGLGYAFVSGYVHYTVISTDVNHTAWTGVFV